MFDVFQKKWIRNYSLSTFLLHRNLGSCRNWKTKTTERRKTGTQKQRGWLVIVSDYRKERWKQTRLKIIILRKHRKGLKRRKHKKLKNNNQPQKCSWKYKKNKRAEKKRQQAHNKQKKEIEKEKIRNTKQKI